MAVTRLVRKAKKNRTVSKKRVAEIKRLSSTPVIKHVDIEQIKEEFAKKKAASVAKKDDPVKESPKTEEAPKAEAKETKEAKKPAAKEEAPKAKKEKASAPKAAKEEDPK